MATKAPPPRIGPIASPARPAFEANKELLLREFAIRPVLSAEAQATCPIPEQPATEGLTDLLACRGGDAIVVDLSLGRRLEIVRRLLKAGKPTGEILEPIRAWATELDAANPSSTVPEAPIARLVLGYALLAGNSDPDGFTWAKPAIETWQADPETRMLAARMWASVSRSCTAQGAPTICGLPAIFREDLKMHMTVVRRLGGRDGQTELAAIREALAGDPETVAALGPEAQASAEPDSVPHKRRRQEVRRVGVAPSAAVLKVFIDPVDGLLAVGHMDPSQHGSSLVRVIFPDQLSDDTFEALKRHLEDGANATCPPEGRTCAAARSGNDFGTEFEFVPRDGRVFLRRIVYYMGQ
jgi:hypothetical protein